MLLKGQEYTNGGAFEQASNVLRNKTWRSVGAGENYLLQKNLIAFGNTSDLSLGANNPGIDPAVAARTLL